MKNAAINDRILSGCFNEQELDSIIEAVKQEKVRQKYVKSLKVGDAVLYKDSMKKDNDIGKIIEVNDRRGYFLASVKRKVRTVEACVWYKDVILPSILKGV